MDKAKYTTAEKEAKGQQWYKDRLNEINSASFSNSKAFSFSDGIKDRYSNMQSNYDLFNGRINKDDFAAFCKPFGDGVGELPIEFTNKDILSGKAKAVLGMEMTRPQSYKVFAINEEATSRREQEEFGRISEFVYSTIMGPIQERISQELEAESQGQELTPDQQAQMQQQMEQQVKAQTPPEVKKYMARKHQDPAEALAHQILEYLTQELNIYDKFNTAWKHAVISSYDLFWVGALNGEPRLRVVNPLNFDADNINNGELIEDGLWAVEQLWLNPMEVFAMFPDLTTEEINKIHANRGKRLAGYETESLEYVLGGANGNINAGKVRVLHGEWKALRPVKFLQHYDLETGEILEDMVDESYKINYEAGDIEVKTVWVVSKFEGYLIDTDIYKNMQEIKGQHRDPSNLNNCKLSFMGAAMDSLNSEPTSIMDRMKEFQYLYNVLFFKIINLINSDDGKVLLLNSNLIPKSKGINVQDWMYFLKVNKVGLLDPTEEGNKFGSDISNAAKEIDLSLASQIQNYIGLATYIEERCGQSVGITKQIEGQIGSYESVRNTQQAIVQSANILEPYFNVHNLVKKNVLQALLDVAKICYVEKPPTALAYVLDDLSLQLLTVDSELLSNSVYGVYVASNSGAAEALEAVQQLSHAALQNQKIELSDVIKVMRSKSLQEAEELLQVAESDRMEREEMMQQQQSEALAEQAELQREYEKEKIETNHQNKLEEIRVKAEYDVQRQAILAMGFNEDKDMDRDGVPDVLEVARLGVDAEIKSRELDLKSKQMDLQDKQHRDKMEVEKEKVKTSRMKATKPSM